MPPAAPSPSAAPSANTSWRLHWLLMPAAALLAVLPLLIHGTSCGHDQGFHLVSWLDAAAQLRHGHWPLWAIAPAWNAGEPRFLFYPPLSWLTGALLSMLMPAPALPIVYIFIVLTAAGLAMHRLASAFVAPAPVLLAAAFYLANPYMLFNAFERSAFAELLAAAWMPLLLLAVLRDRPTARGIAVPLALLWLTNAPAAVMGSYTLALLAVWRVAATSRSRLRLALTCIAGTVLGLALPAFYLIPAAFERRYVQVEMAIIPNMRFQDNFLFDNTADASHNGVNHNISLLAIGVLALTVLAVAALLLQRKRNRSAIPLALLTVLIALLLFPISTPIWQHLPELAFLQFPWRLLTVLSTVLALSFALLLDGASSKLEAAWMTRSHRALNGSAAALALLLALGLGFLLYAHTAQGCELRDRPSSIANSLASGHGVQATDEYTPTNADNDLLRTGNPGYWIAARPTDPAPGTVPTSTELNPAADTDDLPVPFNQTLSTPAPRRFTVDLARPAYLVLNLRDYPNWDVTGCGDDSMACEHYPQMKRDDGLIVLALPRGQRTVRIAWHRSLDQTLGLIVSAVGLLCLGLASFMGRTGAQQAYYSLQLATRVESMIEP